jgi:chaperonin GroEL (HSP60 family)
MKGGGGGNYQRDVEPYIKYTKPLGSGSKNTSDSDCRQIEFTTTLQKTTAALKKVAINDILKIQLQAKDILVVLNASKEECGNIATAHNAKVIECIGKGVKFAAIVLSITGNSCQVQVKSAK